jgi:hypothetical protein
MKFKVTNSREGDLRLAIEALRGTMERVSAICVSSPQVAKEELHKVLLESSSFAETYECKEDLRIIEDLEFDEIMCLIRQKGEVFRFKFKDSNVTFCSDENHLFAYMMDGSDFFDKAVIEDNISNYDKANELFKLIFEIKKCGMRLKISDFSKENTTSGLEYSKESRMKEKVQMIYYTVELTGTDSGYVDLEISDKDLDYRSLSTDDDNHLMNTLKVEIPRYFGAEDEYMLFTDGDDESSADFYVSVRRNKFGKTYIESYFDNDAKNLVDVVNNIDSDDILSLWKFSIEDGLV